MTLPHPLPDGLVELVARRFRVIADPTRIKVLDALRDGERSVNDLAARLGAGQQNVSKHLCVLADAGIVARRKDGNRVYYRIVDAGVFELCEDVCGSLEQQLQTLAALVGGPVTTGETATRPARSSRTKRVAGTRRPKGASTWT